MPRVIDLLDQEGLIEGEEPDAEARRVGDLTREPVGFPAARDVRLQNLAIRAQVNALVVNDDAVKVEEDCVDHELMSEPPAIAGD